MHKNQEVDFLEIGYFFPHQMIKCDTSDLNWLSFSVGFTMVAFAIEHRCTY